MKPTKQLIRGLRETAQRLRQPDVKYCWSSAARCNCGQLAQTLLGIDEQSLIFMRGGNMQLDSCWTIAAAEEASFCKSTGLPMHRVFTALAACGVELEDYERIEYLAASQLRHEDPIHVAAWMDAEADKLEARRAAGERLEK